MYKTKFLKKLVVEDWDPAADGPKTWELTDNPLGAVWLTIKGDLVAADECDEDLMDLITAIDVWMGGFNVVHYINTRSAVLMNCLLKQHRYMLIGNGQAIDDIRAVSFPILFGAPYLNDKMCLPYDKSNRKTITLNMDIADASFDDLLVSIHEVVLPDAKPVGFIKQEEISQAAQGTGDKDIWLQRNWDLLKLIFKCPTVPVDAAWTATINRAGLEIDDFVFGYQGVEWETLHGELMDEVTGMGGIDNHFHADPASGNTGYPENLETWIREFAVMDFFFEKDLKWRAPLSVASTAKLKLNYGVDEAIYYAQANYVTINRLMKTFLPVA